MIVTATTDKKPKPRYTAGLLASRVTTARRLVPAGKSQHPAPSDVVFAAQNGSSSNNGPDRVVVIYPNGTYKPGLTSADGLASPSATAVRGNRLYITDGGVLEPHDPKLQAARINFPALLAGAAR